MVASAGRDFLLQLSDGASPTPAYTTVAGLTQVSLDVAGTTVDVTTMDSAGIQTLLAAAGTTSCNISAEGVFTDSAGHNTILNAVKARTFIGIKINNATNSFTVVGSFQPTAFNLTGAEGDKVTYSLSLVSAGAFTIATS